MLKKAFVAMRAWLVPCVTTAFTLTLIAEYLHRTRRTELHRRRILVAFLAGIGACLLLQMFLFATKGLLLPSERTGIFFVPAVLLTMSIAATMTRVQSRPEEGTGSETGLLDILADRLRRMEVNAHGPTLVFFFV